MLPGHRVPNLVAASARGSRATSAAAETIWPGRAEAALERVAADERVDERVVAQALDRRHLAVADGVRERDAREHRHAVELHGARAAVALAAGDLRPGQAEVVAQHARRASGRPAASTRYAAAVDAELKHRSSPRGCRRGGRAGTWRGSRAAGRRSSSSSGSVARGRAPPRAARGSARARSRAHAVALGAGVEREPEHADRVRLRVQSSGVAIERYWWMRANVIGCENVCSPVGGVGSSGGSPSAMRSALPASMLRRSSSSSPASSAVRSAISSDAGCWPYG